MKMVAGLAFVFNTICFATYYAVAKEALGRIDPIIFTYFEMMTLVPFSIIILLCSWKRVTRLLVWRGMLLGSTLCLALFTIAIALKYTTATSVAFFPALNGALAAVFARLFLRRSTRKTTWLAAILSVGGVAMLIWTSAMDGWRGIVIAFLGGLFFTAYIFVSDSVLSNSSGSAPTSQEYWPLFGVELLTMAVWANLVVLLFADWPAIHPALPKDVFVIGYVAVFCTFLPTFIAAFMQRYISPVTVSFIYILEPVLAAIVAAYYLREMLPMAGYAGGLLIVLGAIIHVWGSIGQKEREEQVEQEWQAWQPGEQFAGAVSVRSGMPAWDITRSGIQVGALPYSIARKGEKHLLQRRRRERVRRLGSIGIGESREAQQLR